LTFRLNFYIKSFLKDIDRIDDDDDDDDDDKLTDPDFDVESIIVKLKIVLNSCCYILLP